MCNLFDVSVHNNEKSVHGVFVLFSRSVSRFSLFSFDYRLCCYFECWLHTNTHAINAHTYTASVLLSRSCSCSHSLSLATHTKAFRVLTFRLKCIYISKQIRCMVRAAKHTHSEMSNKSHVWMQWNVHVNGEVVCEEHAVCMYWYVDKVRAPVKHICWAIHKQTNTSARWMDGCEWANSWCSPLIWVRISLKTKCKEEMRRKWFGA